MFVQNQINHLENHRKIISAEIDNAEEVIFVVSYVKKSGVNLILNKIKGKPTKLLCSLDMGITQIEGIEKLLENNVEVKVYKSGKGTFHPKIWLFGKNSQWKMLVGSANLSFYALTENVEASILIEGEEATEYGVKFFNYLWSRENSTPISLKEARILREKIIERKKIKNKTIRKKDIEKDAVKKTEILFEYVKTWIDIPKFDSYGISSLWRGWYIIPDQGYINDYMIENLASYLPFLEGGIPLNESDERYMKLLTEFIERSDFQRKNLKTSPHKLFVRQAKNYLIKFGWCCHPVKQNGKLDKGTLVLTELGRKIKQCKNLGEVKNLYTEYFYNYEYNGLNIVQFTGDLLQRLNHITLDEFDCFVTHVYNYDELDMISELVEIYRSISDPNDFKDMCVKYFNEIKGPTGKNVHGNYVKSIKHNVSVIGWCEGFKMDDEFTLRLDDEFE